MAYIGAAVVPHGPMLIETVAKSHAAAGARIRDACRLIGGYFVQRGLTDLIVVSPHGVSSSEYLPILIDEPLIGSLKEFGDVRPITLAAGLAFGHSLLKQCEKDSLPARSVVPEEGLDYGALVPLELCHLTTHVRVVVISVLNQSSERSITLGNAIREAADASPLRVGLIASADFTRRVDRDPRHDRPTPNERAIARALRERDITQLPKFEDSPECGLSPVATLLSSISGRNGESEVLASGAPYGVGHIAAWIGV